jgi:hypothetical protein
MYTVPFWPTLCALWQVTITKRWASLQLLSGWACTCAWSSACCCCCSNVPKFSVDGGFTSRPIVVWYRDHRLCPAVDGSDKVKILFRIAILGQNLAPKAPKILCHRLQKAMWPMTNGPTLHFGRPCDLWLKSWSKCNTLNGSSETKILIETSKIALSDYGSLAGRSWT